MIYFVVVMTMLFVGCKSGSVIENQTNKPVESKIDNVTDYKVNVKEYILYNEKNKPFIVKYAQISGVGNESLDADTGKQEWYNHYIQLR